MYVLIIASWFSGYAGGYGFTTQEFSSLERCDAAAAIVRSEMKTWGAGDGRTRSFCVQK